MVSEPDDERSTLERDAEIGVVLTGDEPLAREEIEVLLKGIGCKKVGVPRRNFVVNRGELPGGQRADVERLEYSNLASEDLVIETLELPGHC